MSIFDRLGGLMSRLSSVKVTAPGPAEAESAPPSVRPALSVEEAHVLADIVRKDWTRLLTLLLEGVAPLVKHAKDEESIEAMALRIAVRGLKIGALGTAWSKKEKPGKKVGSRKTKALVDLLELGSCKTGELPPELERAATAFLAKSEVAVVDGQRVRVDDAERDRLDQEHRDRATLAAFYAYLRLVSEMQEEIALAAQSSTHVKPVSEEIASALVAVGAVPIAPDRGEAPDLARVKICGYVDGEPIGAVATVRKPGLAYRSEVVRKADVTLGREKKPPVGDEAVAT